MQRFILVFLAVLSLTSFAASVGQIRTGKPSHAEDRVIIQRHRIVLVRNADVAKRFPDRRTAVVTYPVITGLRDPAVLRRVRLALEFKNIFDYSLKEYREDPWLTEFNYLVNYNRNYFLDITFTQSGMAAYPDEQHKHFLISLKDGRIVTARDVFEPNKLNSLAEMVDRELQREIKRIAHENRSPDEKEAINGAYDNLKFELKELDEFSIGPKGITFLYDAGFPHVIKAFEPRGKYFFTYTELKPFIKRDGLLGQFVD
jgi:hypothetical protein